MLQREGYDNSIQTSEASEISMDDNRFTNNGVSKSGFLDINNNRLGKKNRGKLSGSLDKRSTNCNLNSNSCTNLNANDEEHAINS